jgi:hypothetical protein
MSSSERRSTPQATVEAIMFCVRERGVSALKESPNIARLRTCDGPARTQINHRIAELSRDRAHGHDYVAEALSDAGIDPSLCANKSAPATEGESEIARLAKLPPLAYEQERVSAAERLGARTSILDSLVSAERSKSEPTTQGRAVSLPEPEAWPTAVAGDALLSDIAATIRQHVILPDHAADASAVWVLHTYLLAQTDISPRLAITSPEKGCGKTTLLDLLSCLVWRALAAANATAAAIFRVVEMQQPTILIDEADTFLPNNEELRGILNSGHRRSGSVLRTVGDNHEPRQFATYSACAIALIGKLPATLADRSITIELRRRRSDEAIEPLRLDRCDHLLKVARQAARWARDKAAHVRSVEPLMPTGAFNRVADNWRALLAIADAAGGEWPKRGRAALEAMTGAAMDDQSAGVLVLADIHAIFESRGVDRLSSADAIGVLATMEDRPWGEWRGGKPLTAHGLARLLAPFHIAPVSIRMGDKTPKGYLRAAFTEAWSRYLPGKEACEAQHRNNAHAIGISANFENATRVPVLQVENCKKTGQDGLCCECCGFKARSNEAQRRPTAGLS